MVDMDRLSAFNSGAGRLTLNAANEQYAAQARALQQQERGQEQVRQENERAAQDTVEISDAARELLRQLGDANPISA
jgi:hypothetical protein